jgi:Ca2+/Na+ antiporter
MALPERTPAGSAAWLNLLGMGLLVAAIFAARLFATDVGDTLTRYTVRLSLAWYAAALCLLMRLRARDWSATTYSGQLARWCWTWAWMCFLVHLFMAFHYYHHWSHNDAFERTRRISGAGEGLYVSYLFTWLWTLDVIAWWLWPARYAARPVVVDRALHGFMLFIVFNSMVVFETGMIRWAGLVMFAMLAIAWFVSRPRAVSRFNS